MDKQTCNAQCQGNRIVINDWYAITKMNTGCFILSDIKKDKDTGQLCYPAIAVYSNELKLAADVINLSVKRGVFLKTITDFSGLIRVSNVVADMCTDAIRKLNRGEVQ